MNCKACGKKTYQEGQICTTCKSSLATTIMMKCPRCSKSGQAKPGIFLEIELPCGHTLTPISGAGWVVGDTSIKSKKATA